jgi:Fe-S-cluster containining protein
MSPESFVARYCHEKNERVYIKTGADNFCIFFNKEKQCLIHPVKPEPCSEWPFYPAIVKDEDTWEGARDACPGFNPDCSFSEFVKQAKEEEVTQKPGVRSQEPEFKIKESVARSQ